MDTFGTRLKQLRLNRNMTQRDMATRLNITEQAVSRWENDQTQPDFDTLRAISRIFDVSIDDLLIGHPENSDASATEKTAEAGIFAAETQTLRESQRLSQTQTEMVGICTSCGNVVTQHNFGHSNPLLCTSCFVKKLHAKYNKLTEKIDSLKTKFTKAIVCGILVGLFIGAMPLLRFILSLYYQPQYGLIGISILTVIVASCGMADIMMPNSFLHKYMQLLNQKKFNKGLGCLLFLLFGIILGIFCILFCCVLILIGFPCFPYHAVKLRKEIATLKQKQGIIEKSLRDANKSDSPLAPELLLTPEPPVE